MVLAYFGTFITGFGITGIRNVTNPDGVKTPAKEIFKKALHS